MERRDIPMWWSGPGRYWMTNGVQERHLGYCASVQELVDAVAREEADRFDLRGATIVRPRSIPRAEMTHEQWLASHLPDVLVDD
jgi:hypothetical protein